MSSTKKKSKAKPAHKPAKTEKKKQKQGWFARHFSEN